MKRSATFIAAIMILGLSFQASARVDDQVEYYKWIQPPDMVTENGLDLQSQWDSTDSEPDIIKADDWLCPDGRPVTDIHWWGSYLNNEEFTPDGFAILIYEDFYDVNKDFFRPGALLEDYFVPICDANQTSIGPDFYDETVYEYSVYLPEDDWFEQEEGEWYWISIVAITPDIGNTPVWGWHTSLGPLGPDGGLIENEPAVTGKVWQDDGMPGIPEGNPDEWAWISYDMAFALTTVPEPGTLALFGTALVGLFAIRRRRK